MMRVRIFSRLRGPVSGLITLILAVGCVSQDVNDSTPVLLREKQSRTYNDIEEIVVYKAIVNALLDEGFTLRLSDSSAGVLTASISKTEFNSAKLVGGMALTFLTGGLWALTIPFLYAGDLDLEQRIEVTANVTPLSGAVKARMNFVANTYKKEKLKKSVPIEDHDFYNAIFAKVDKSIFLEENL